MKNKTIIITGASDGIGAAAAKILKETGAQVVIIGRSPEKTKSIADKLALPYYIADFSMLDEVRELADKLLRDFPKIDVLVNNAGGIMAKRELTVDGHEKTFQVNHLAPFLLTSLLMQRLIENKAVIINTSSVANKIFGNIDINDLENEKNYSPNKAYGDGKLANILFTHELERRFGKQGITTAAFHPGNVATNFSAGSTSLLRFIYRTPFKHFLLTSEKGADTLVWLATSQPGVDWMSGAYYEKRQLAKMNQQADDDTLAQKLWDKSNEMVAKEKIAK